MALRMPWHWSLGEWREPSSINLFTGEGSPAPQQSSHSSTWILRQPFTGAVCSHILLEGILSLLIRRWRPAEMVSCSGYRWWRPKSPAFPGLAWSQRASDCMVPSLKALLLCRVLPHCTCTQAHPNSDFLRWSQYSVFFSNQVTFKRCKLFNSAIVILKYNFRKRVS